MLGIRTQSPHVQLDSIVIKHFAPIAIDLDVYLTVSNPNRFALRLRNINYRLVAENQTLASGAYEHMITIEDYSQVRLPVTIAVPHIVATLGKTLLSGNLPKIQWQAQFDFVSPVGNFSVPMNAQKAVVLRM